ncbi:MAG: DUF2235 domain-containing protein, partial [Pseudomonadota bacterium]
MRLDRRIRRVLRRAPLVRRIVPKGPVRTPRDHVVILDGTNSSLVAGYETNAGILFKLLRETYPAVHLSLHYEAGVQWDSWRQTPNVVSGYGINGRIRRAYGAIASRYRPGDRIFLFGFSRGAYAVRSLAGILASVGLLRPEAATESNIRMVFRHYECSANPDTVAGFRARHCHEEVPIEMVGVWDTVKALGMRVPLLWMLSEGKHKFHDHRLSPLVRHGYHALALDERRMAFAPVLWETPDDHPGHVEQMWFKGTHGDIGGQLCGLNRARPLSNIPLLWMLEKAETCGLVLPQGWTKRFECDSEAPSVGLNHGWGKLFLARRARVVARDPSERVHPSTGAVLGGQGGEVTGAVN